MSSLVDRLLLTPRWTNVIPHAPTPKQSAFLLLPQVEALFGGAAGGGKSEALLMGALQYVDRPDYSALLLRRRITDSSLPGALLARAHQWLHHAARWDDADKTWTFSSGATLTFGYLDAEHDRYRYQSSEFQYIGFDELTQFNEDEYLYLFSRLRRSANSEVPLRMRSASNPGGLGHDWVRRRFILERGEENRRFIPASIVDNPHLDQEEYIESLSRLDAVTRAQLLDGDWNAHDDALIAYDDIVACEADTLWLDEWNKDDLNRVACLPPSQRPSSLALRTRQAWASTDPGKHAPRRSKRRELFLGVDVGRTRDRTVIWIWERLGDVFWCRRLQTLHNATFREQADAIKRSITREVVRGAIDKGGIGFQLAEELEREFPDVIEGVALGPGVQVRLARRLEVAFRERRCRIPSDPDLRQDLRLVRRPRAVGSSERVETGRSEVGHADRFWAAALALDAAASVMPSKPTPRASLPRSQKPGEKK